MPWWAYSSKISAWLKKTGSVCNRDHHAFPQRPCREPENVVTCNSHPTTVVNQVLPLIRVVRQPNEAISGVFWALPEHRPGIQVNPADRPAPAKWCENRLVFALDASACVISGQAGSAI
jgi:hypothetical protein